jgi:hypothetical protein
VAEGSLLALLLVLMRMARRRSCCRCHRRQSHPHRSRLLLLSRSICWTSSRLPPPPPPPRQRQQQPHHRHHLLLLLLLLLRQLAVVGCLGRTGKKTALFVRFYTKFIILPRQARDKHRENSKKSTVFLLQRAHAREAEDATPRDQGGKKTPLFAPFIYKSHPFTKTGSGQT